MFLPGRERSRDLGGQLGARMGFAAQRLVELEVESLTGAAHAPP
jgi:hypothetical protein